MKGDEVADWDVPRADRYRRPFVYVLSCIGEDLTKVGFTRDPVQRLRNFHPRFFSMFDLEQGMLLEVGSLREARRMERLLIERWPQQRAPAPLLISDAAGGDTEWFRGIGEDARVFLRRLAERYGYDLHCPLRAWLHERFVERADQLYEWSGRLLAMIVWQSDNHPPSAQDPRYARALADTLDACRAVGMQLDDLLPSDVLAWYARWRSFQF